MACAICQDRRPRRFCPGVRGEICSLCCGAEREVSVACPLDCEFLREARRHEKSVQRSADEFPNRDIHVPEALLEANEQLLTFLSMTIFRTAMQVSGVVDGDVLEALDGLIRTYRSLQSGIYYESRPNNPLAGSIYGTVQDALAEYRKAELESLDLTKTRDADILGLLVFLQRYALNCDNGRRRGRAFLDALRELQPSAPEPSGSPPSSIVLR